MSLEGREYGMTSPPAIVDDLVICGMSVGEALHTTAPGDIRAFDVRTGRERWRFHTVPRPGETGHDTWEGESWKNRGGVNAWSGLTVDRARHLVFAGLGAAALRLLRRRSQGRQPVREQHARARRAHRCARLALPDHSPRHLGLGSADAAGARHRHARRTAHRRGRADHQDRLRLPLRSRDRAAALPDRRARRSPIRHSRRAPCRERSLSQ